MDFHLSFIMGTKSLNGHWDVRMSSGNGGGLWAHSLKQTQAARMLECQNDSGLKAHSSEANTGSYYLPNN